MATNTTNFGLKKPAYSDTADIADINGNMDKVDVSLNGLADAIAIVANNNTHAAITAGQYVYVHGHGSMAEGLYTAKSNIAANATLSTSNLQADGSGGLNSVYASLNSKFVNHIGSKTKSELESALTSIAGSMADGDVQHFSVYVSETSGVFTATTYIGFLERSSSTRFYATISQSGQTTVIHGIRNDGGWSWDTLALNSKIATLFTPQFGSVTITGTGSGWKWETVTFRFSNLTNPRTK